MDPTGWPDSASDALLDAIIAAADQSNDPAAVTARALAVACKGHCPSETSTDAAGVGYESLTLAEHQNKVIAAHAVATRTSPPPDWSACVGHLQHTTGGWPAHDGDANQTQARLEYIRDNAKVSTPGHYRPGGDAARSRAIKCLSHCPHWITGRVTSVAGHRQSVKEAYDDALQAGNDDALWADVANELDHAGGGVG